MAIKDLVDVAGMNNVYNISEDAYEQLENAYRDFLGTDNIIQGIIDRLNSYKRAIEEEEKQILRKFNVKNEGELQEKFRIYYSNSGLSNLSGPTLQEAIVEGYEAYVQNDFQTLNRKKYIQQRIMPIIEPIIKEYTDDLGVTFEEYVGQQFNKILNGLVVNISEGKATFSREVSSMKPIAANELKKSYNVLASKLSIAQKNRIDFLLKKEFGIDNSRMDINTSADSSLISTDVTITWESQTGGRTETEAKSLPKEKRDLINENIIKIIENQVNPNYKGLVRKYLKKMLGTKGNEYLFFVGKNTNEITGLLGELSAIIAISQLLEGVNPDKIINWVATRKVKGKSLSIDIILKNIGGINIKNTTKDLEKIPLLKISYAGKNAESIFKTFKQAYGVDFNPILGVYESEAFNVPYAGYNPYYRVELEQSYHHGAAPSDWESFKDVYEKMTQLRTKINILLTAMAPDFLYMSGGKEFKNQLAVLDRRLSGARQITGNVLYINARMPFLASGLLDNIIKDIDILTNLKEEATFFNLNASLGSVMEGKKKVPYNIIAYLNGKKGSKYTSRKVKLTSSGSYDMSV